MQGIADAERGPYGFKVKPCPRIMSSNACCEGKQ